MSTTVSSMQRFTRRHPCPICGGGEDLPRGQGRRCTGYLSVNGEYAYCSREEHAGELLMEMTDPPTFRHRLEGDCHCGSRHGGLPEPLPSANGRGELVASYDYVDEAGALLFQVCRLADKSFLQRRPDGTGDWIWNRQGVEPVLYRLPQVLAAVEADETIYVVEGEKDVEAAERAGVVATTNPGGAGKWRPQFADELRGAKVVVVADRDEAGLKHAGAVVASLNAKAARMEFVRPAEGKDLSDHLAAGLSLEQLEPLPSAAQSPAEDELPFAMPIREFIVREREYAEPLLADADGRAAIGRNSLTLLGALGGHGKTTFFIDLALHLAAGVDYPPYTVPRPASILLIENEGPEDLFAAKLEARLASFPHELKARLDVCVYDWGGFSLRAEEARERLTREIAEKGYDLVFGDPLDSLGIEGVGSPEDTRKFLELMKETGLNKRTAWWLNTHPRKEETREALNEISGAWGGKPDAVLLLRMLDDDRTQIRQAKLRWAKRGKGPTLLLGFDPETEAFTFLGEESEVERDYLAEIEALLADEQWRTPREIAAPTKDGGIGANVDTVKKELETHPDLFGSRTGEAAKEVGRHASATVWQKVTQASESPESPCDF
jgi:AAA domain